LNNASNVREVRYIRHTVLLFTEYVYIADTTARLSAK